VASDGTTTYSRDASGALTGESDPTGATMAWTDLHGDLIGQFTASGTSLTGSASYDPWGTTTASTLTGTVGYQSGFTDPATGNVNLHARWYSPTTADTQQPHRKLRQRQPLHLRQRRPTAADRCNRSRRCGCLGCVGRCVRG